MPLESCCPPQGLQRRFLQAGATAAKVADGKADIAIVPITDIHAKDAKLIGPLPEPIQLWTVYAAAIPKASAAPAAGKAFVAAMTEPAMQPRWVKAGWQPAK